MPHFNAIRLEFELTIRCRSVSLSAMKYILFPALVAASLFAAANAAEAKITVAECDTDYADMLAEAENNRKRSLDELERELRYTSNDEAAANINAMIEQTWHMEETFISHAVKAYRDCVKYAKSDGS